MGGWHASDLDDVPTLEGCHIMAYILHFLPALVGIMYSFLMNRYIVPKEGYPSLGLCLNTCIELKKREWGEPPSSAILVMGCLLCRGAPHARDALPTLSWDCLRSRSLLTSLWGCLRWRSLPTSSWDCLRSHSLLTSSWDCLH